MPVDFVEDLANKFMFKNHMQKKELWLFLDNPISDKLFSRLSSTDCKVDCLLTLYSTFIPNLSWSGVRVQAQIPAEIGEEADVISIHTRHPGHCCVKGKCSRDSIRHCRGDILLPVLLTPLVSGQGPVMLKAQCSPAPTWMPSCKTASYRATTTFLSQVPCSTQSALLFPLSIQFKPLMYKNTCFRAHIICWFCCIPWSEKPVQISITIA